MNKALWFLFLVTQFIYSCSHDRVKNKNYLTKYIVVLVVDGPRYSETWGDFSHKYIPFMDSVLAPEGIVFTSYYNLGQTWTTNGHTALTTGYYQAINNGGQELPVHSSFFQHWLNESGNDQKEAWIIASKDKLQVLANCKDTRWKNKSMPSTDCGVSGLGSGYRHDSITFKKAIEVMNAYHPKLLLVNFREPDFSGHQNNWGNYLAGIKNSDAYCYEIWKKIQSDPIYKDKTSLFISNDHGRHLNGVQNGFVSHGDDCDGCRHINLYCFGPDFKSNSIDSSPHSLIDVHATILELLHLNGASTSGEVMREIFKQ